MGKTIYMNQTVALIHARNGDKERDILVSQGKVIEREHEEPYLVIEDKEEEKNNGK